MRAPPQHGSHLAASERRDVRTNIQWSQYGPTVLPFLLVGILFGIGSAIIDGFASTANVRALLVLCCFLGVASIGQTLVILLGEIDLSIPAVIGMADVLTTHLYGEGHGFLVAAVAVAGMSLIVGAVNGLATRLLRAHSLIVTLATSSIVLGAVLVITQGKNSGSVPAWLTHAVSPIGRMGPLPLPPIIGLWALLTVVVIFIQRRTVFGRRLYATGTNAVAARFALVRQNVVWTLAFCASALCAAVAGVLLAGFSGGADPNVGAPYLFTTVAAVVVGGTSLIGGRGGYGRTVAGVLLITVITTLLVGLGWNDQVRQILLGLLIIVMIGIYGRQAHVRSEI